MKSKNLSIGIDLGGTKIATGLVNSQGKLLNEDKHPTKATNHDTLTPKKQIEYCVNAMADTALNLVAAQPGKTLKAKSAGIVGVGLAAAGPLDVNNGLIIHPPNLGDWGVVPIVKLLSAALKKRGLDFKIYFQNDAIAAALAEGWIGRAKKCSTYAMITLGTGVGTGVILEGKPAQSKGMGSEWGHHIVDIHQMEKDPDDFYHATLEGLASGTGILRHAKRRGYKGNRTTELALAARDGDKLALEIFESAAHALAAGFYNLSIGFRIEKFTYTGGLLPVADLFVPKAIELYNKMILATAPDFQAKVEVSKLGNKAGIIGAARLPFL